MPIAKLACRLIALLVCGALPTVRAESVAHVRGADDEWQELLRLAAEKPADFENRSRLEQFTASNQHRDQIHSLAERIFEEHPADPRHWQAALYLLTWPPSFVTKVDAVRYEQDGERAVMRDEAAKAKWEDRAARLYTDLMAAPEAKEEWKQDAMRWQVLNAGRDAVTQLKVGDQIDLAALRARLDTWLDRFPKAARVGPPITFYMSAVALMHPDEIKTEWSRFAQSRNPEVREFAEGRLFLLHAEQQAADWKFTAVDGRTVDLAKLRGRIVLLDFWATWCVPCRAEIPYVVAAFQKYHDRGFEIIGVSLDRAEDKPKLEQFVHDRGMGWPQFFDGRFWQNAAAVRYGVKSIPTMVLLDRRGHVVPAAVKGEMLDAQVAQLLATP
jgi:thiol-disulfide isomerase/thioredoxin